MARLDKLFGQLPGKGVSDVHLSTGLPTKARISGDLHVVWDHALTLEQSETYMKELVSERQWELFLAEGELDFAYGLPGVVRLRANYFVHERGYGAVFRLIPTVVQTWQEAGVPPVVAGWARLTSGLILFTGPTGSGKSTSLAAIINAINEHEARHIITIEQPIEFVHDDKKSTIAQREVGLHAPTFARALRAALREDPDVILVGELRDHETMAMALAAGEMGYLVLGTLHTNGAARAVSRMLDMFPVDRQPSVRVSLANCLRGICSQQLVRSYDGRGRHAVHEVLVGSPALSNLIRAGNTAKIYSTIQAGRRQGMQTMDQSLEAAVLRRTIDPEEAWRLAEDKSVFDQYVSGPRHHSASNPPPPPGRKG